MSHVNTFVIVGGGLAAAKAAEELRRHGHDGPLLVIGDEGERPYVRPPLSKGYLLGKEDRESIHVHPEGWYREHDVDLMLGTRVTSLDARAGEVTVDDSMSVNVGDVIGTIRALIESGARTEDAVLRDPSVPLEDLLRRSTRPAGAEA